MGGGESIVHSPLSLPSKSDGSHQASWQEPPAKRSKRVDAPLVFEGAVVLDMLDVSAGYAVLVLDLPRNMDLLDKAWLHIPSTPAPVMLKCRLLSARDAFCQAGPWSRFTSGAGGPSGLMFKGTLPIRGLQCHEVIVDLGQFDRQEGPKGPPLPSSWGLPTIQWMKDTFDGPGPWVDDQEPGSSASAEDSKFARPSQRSGSDFGKVRLELDMGGKTFYIPCGHPQRRDFLPAQFQSLRSLTPFKTQGPYVPLFRDARQAPWDWLG